MPLIDASDTSNGALLIFPYVVIFFAAYPFVNVKSYLGEAIISPYCIFALLSSLVYDFNNSNAEVPLAP